MGIGPGHGLPDGPLPSYESLREDTFAAYGDWDASPTKAWLLTHEDEPGMAQLVEYSVGRRPEWELYDVRRDPHSLRNLADDTKYADVRERLAELLLDELTATGDPRVTEEPVPFEQSPFTDAVVKRKK
jgi:uncharacterized sulfatase